MQIDGTLVGVQVRRMFAACGAHVQELERISFGRIELDMLRLEQGQWMHLPLNVFDSVHAIPLCDTTRYQRVVDVPT
jgi:hypothetical protein